MKLLESILSNAKNNQWTYPKTFQTLADAGVASYTVSFIGSFNALYEGTFGIWNEPAPTGYVSPVLGDEFSTEGVKMALRRHMAGETNYIEFLADLAAQGVSHYRVDMGNRTVTYFNDDETHSHQENVPVYQNE